MGIIPKFITEKYKKSRDVLSSMYNKLPEVARDGIMAVRNRVAHTLNPDIDRAKNYIAHKRQDYIDIKARIGMMIDKFGASALGIISDMIGKPKEGEKGALNWIREKCDTYYQKWEPRLDRYPPEAGTEEAVIANEKEYYTESKRDIDDEKKVDVRAMLPDQEIMAKAMAGYINRKRRGRKLSLLPANHAISEAARRRASYITRYQPKNLRDFASVLHRPDEKKDGESDENHDKLYLEANGKKAKMDYVEYWHSFDISDFNFPLEGNFHLILDKLYQNKFFKEDLKGDKSHLAISVYPLGDKLTVGVVALKDNSLLRTDLGDQPEYTGSKYWFNQIPEEKRREGSELWNIFHGTDEKPAFESGYSLYHLHLFQERLERIRLEEDIEIKFSAQIEKKAKKMYLNLTINGEKEEKLELIKGTGAVKVQPDSFIVRASKQKEDEGAAAKENYLNLDDYGDKMEIFCKSKLEEEKMSRKRYPVVSGGSPTSESQRRSGGGRSSSEERRARGGREEESEQPEDELFV